MQSDCQLTCLTFTLLALDLLGEDGLVMEIDKITS